MNDQQLLRYSRQILLPQIDIEGQQKLLDSRILVVGVGGLGSPIALYLAGAGVGQLTLVDPDEVELSNLQRQILHDSNVIGLPKVESARRRLQALNPEVEVRPIAARLEGKDLEAVIAQADVVVDGSDNFATRFALNIASARVGRPLVSGAAIRMEGQVAVFDSRQPDGACYHCLFQEGGENEEETCSQTGVLAPLLGIIGSVQAMETLKLLLGIGRSLHNRLLLLDGLSMRWRETRIQQDPQCPICNGSRERWRELA
ncbi:HesA/MoeB/ThiF family protein [Nitrosococcus oceani]|uniref:Molybdopterin-synthase adenylyltransferase n=2 Tax=Nitrosococcus oceani TaxID=1229 RepID=Q3JE58_NITOC|nr:molybdopterin-synthase adenylyltransferase MoeB [Nitrosococcus oceani]KFI20671.1 molybdopterin-synthase adenylyltransferase [Nitrosococcus oceani C-27]ABA56888.1 Adenylyltransferase [Nitrosococcus oceani ATCC 19707]EDZ65643.1 MoeZ/MoeB domain family [Nitrosococcus oceani AFC27]KFI23763.1 molybdopterin-synthase adenylyltransferase [Nitrosococcus oceani]GEM21471.1 molybdopterin biosynthesis protein MoeB [Nitrosococcus oceani]